MNRIRIGAALALACVLAAPAARAAGEPLLSAKAFVAKLAANGRAEATLRYTLPAAPGAKARIVYGTLALEPPDRVRLDVPATGERVAARGDGGEWLQPATRQVIRFGPRQVAPALRWWRVLLGDGSLVRERALGEGRFGLAMREGAGVADSATVWLDARGLPSRLEVAGGDGAITYRLSGWRFSKARGAGAFRLAAPAGYETVELP